MDGHAHKITATSAGHEGHEVHLCHRCGWPFPNPHPSAKHRRSHKRVCGTIEGYTIIHSEHHDDHLAVSDDDRASDDDELHTPSPNPVNKNDISGRVGEKSPKSEDDVFSDAVMDFSDSGISPKLEQRFESVGELGKSLEQKSVEEDLYGSGPLKVEEAAAMMKAVTTEKSNDVRSEEISESGPLANGTNQPDIVMITGTAAKMFSVGHINDSQPEHGVGGSVQGEMIPGQEADIQVQEHGSASDLEEGKVLDRTIAAGESRDELCDKLVSEVAKHDPTPSSESLQNLDASEGVNSVVYSAERSTFTETVEVALTDETHRSIDAFAEVKEVSHSTDNIGSTESVSENALPEESILSMHSVKSNESTKSLDVTEHSDVACMVSSIDEEEILKGSLDGGQTASNFIASEGEKSHMTGNGNLESKNLNSIDAVSALGFTNNAFECDDANTIMTKKDVDHCGEVTNSTALETGNENGEGASVEVEVIPDSTLTSEKPTDFPSSCAGNSDAINLQELSENNSSSLELRGDGFVKSIQGHGADKVTEGLQSIGSAGVVSDVNHDALDKNSLPPSSLEHAILPVTSELPTNIHVSKNVVDAESLDVAETVSKLKDDNELIASGITTEHSISKESTSPCSDSALLNGDAAKDDSSVREDAKASEFIVPAEVTSKDHESNVVTREISESPTPSVQEAFPTNKCLNVTSPDVEQTHSSDDLSTLKPVDIISGAEHTFDGKTLTSDEFSVSSESDAPSVKQPVTSPLDVQDCHGTSDTVYDETLANVEDVTNINTKSVQTEVDDKPTKQTDDAGSLTSRSDSLEANCGSVVSDALETNSQKHNIPTEEGHPDKSDTFEPPSFMTLVQSGSEGDQVTAAAEIETVQNNQQQKSDALQAGWFPSLTNVVNESEGRKKNEEIIAKVTNWSPVKQQHGPLKNLLNEVKSPNTKQVPAANQKVEGETKDDNAGVTTTVGSVLTSETHTAKDQDPKKHVEEWNSPARYPIEIKKEKKKGRPFWVPFVCCSTTHRDL